MKCPIQNMVRDGIYYATALAAGGLILTYLTSVWFGLPLFLAAAFCAYFFRDPDRVVPAGPVAVSPADGKVVAVIAVGNQTRISIFLNIFDVHVNRAPISGSISEVKYQKGLFLVASKEKASARNEMNTVTVEGDGTRVVFKQIAGLIARRIVFTKKLGDFVNAGERIGLIKFGSRVDVIFGPEWNLEVRPGMRVSGGSSVLARRSEESLLCRT
ncbi:MAG: phosphatidylserine decarboxylase [Acidobacteriota bacterium]|nr:phosphatidylserine decarboxylase [Acidobacteriota bacterium]